MNAELENRFGPFIDSYTDDPELADALREAFSARPPQNGTELSVLIHDVVNATYKSHIDASMESLTEAFTSRPEDPEE